MRISFVGKGGSGKSTICASFALYLSQNSTKQISVFDADINIHTPKLLGFEQIPYHSHISHPFVSELIKKWLIGGNDIKNLGAFRKSTPPTRKSNLISIDSIRNTPIGEYGVFRDNLSVFAVGTYQDEDIGASCYHNNLATLESILCHTDDKGGYLIADMVAGVDSFAGTLHAQFDLTCLIVEPTMRSIEVYTNYMKLASEAGIADSVMVIGNKIRNDKDVEYINSHIPVNKIIGMFWDDEHIRGVDQDSGAICVSNLSDVNQGVLSSIHKLADSLPDNRDSRLKKIWSIHEKYVSQAYIRERFGDLTGQIDREFTFINANKK
jgi:CO dehydrogenase maturation factor